MDPENFLTPEAGVVALVTAVVFSPRVRGWLRKGAIYLMAGGITVMDSARAAATSFAEGAGHMRRDAAMPAQASQEQPEQQGMPT